MPLRWPGVHWVFPKVQGPRSRSKVMVCHGRCGAVRVRILPCSLCSVLSLLAGDAPSRSLHPAPSASPLVLQRPAVGQWPKASEPVSTILCKPGFGLQ